MSSLARCYGSRVEELVDEDEHGGEEGRIGALELALSSARVIGSSFVALALIALSVMAPSYLAGVALSEWAGAGGVAPRTFAWARLGVEGLGTALTFVAQAAMVHGAVERLAGRPVRLRRSFAVVLGRAGPLLALALIQSLAIGLAVLACVVPAVVLACVLFVSIPAAVVEERGPLEAMQRSADLTRGHRLTLFAVGLPLVLLAVAARYGLAQLALLDLPLRLVGHAGGALVTALFTMSQAVLAAVFYARARRIHDGADVDAIAKVFE